MIRLVSSIILGLSVLVSAKSSSQTINKRTAFVKVDQQNQHEISSIPSNALFGIRGGGLFGGKDDEKAVADAAGGRKTYPPMTQEEVEDWLEHIPVYAVTDSNGAGVVLKPDDDSSVFYFFLSPLAANATLTQLKSTNEEMDLKVSVRHKIWNDIDRLLLYLLVENVFRTTYRNWSFTYPSFVLLLCFPSY